MKVYFIVITTADEEDRDTILKTLQELEQEASMNDAFNVQLSEEDANVTG